MRLINYNLINKPMSTKTFYEIREITWGLDYASYLDQQKAPSNEIIEQLEIVKKDIDSLINNIKEDE